MHLLHTIHVLWNVTLESRFFKNVLFLLCVSARLGFNVGSFQACVVHACMMLTAISTQERKGSRRGLLQHKEHSIKRTFLSLLSSSYLPMLAISYFHNSFLKGWSIHSLLFYIFVIIFGCCSDETFSCDVEVACCVLRWLLCNQLSAVEEESFKRVRWGREGKIWVVFQGSGYQLQVWTPNWYFFVNFFWDHCRIILCQFSSF